MAALCPRVSALVVVRDLALGDLFEGERQVVLRARLDERRRELVERALAELVVVVVDLPRALGGDDHQRVARVDLVEELVDAWMDHRRAMVAVSFEFRSTMRDALVRGALALVVLDHVVELAADAFCSPGERDPLLDLARALGRALARAAARARTSGASTKIVTAPGSRSLTASAPFSSSSRSGTPPSDAIRSSSERSVPERWPHGKTWCSRKSSAARRRSNSSSERNQ